MAGQSPAIIRGRFHVSLIVSLEPVFLAVRAQQSSTHSRDFAMCPWRWSRQAKTHHARMQHFSGIRRQIHIEKAPRIVPRRCCITRSSPRPAAGKRPSLLNKAWDRSQTSTSFAKRRFRAPVNLPPTFPFSSFRRAQIVWLGVIESVSTIERSVGAFSGSVVEKRTTFPVLGVLLQSW